MLKLDSFSYFGVQNETRDPKSSLATPSDLIFISFSLDITTSSKLKSIASGNSSLSETIR